MRFPRFPRRRRPRKAGGQPIGFTGLRAQRNPKATGRRPPIGWTGIPAVKATA